MGSLPSSCCVDQWASFCNNSSYLVLCPLCSRYLVNSASRSLCSSIRLAVNGMRLLSMRTPGSAWDAMRLNYWNSREIILKCETKWLNNPFFLISLWQGPGWCPESFTVLSLLLSNLDKKNSLHRDHRWPLVLGTRCREVLFCDQQSAEGAFFH